MLVRVFPFSEFQILIFRVACRLKLGDYAGALEDCEEVGVWQARESEGWGGLWYDS